MSSPAATSPARSAVVKRGGYFCIFAACTAAWIMSLYAIGVCNFVTRNIDLAGGETIAAICEAIGMPEDQCTNLLGGQGVGFWGWRMSYPQTCYSYTQYVDGIGYVTPDFDRKFNSAKACQGVAVFFGAVAWFTMAFSFCCRIGKAVNKCLAFVFLLAFLFQALAFLIFDSDICKEGFVSTYFGRVLPDGIASVSCSRNQTTNLAIAAVVLYFCAALGVLVVTAPAPLYDLSGADDDNDEKEAAAPTQAAPAAAADAEAPAAEENA